MVRSERACRYAFNGDRAPEQGTQCHPRDAADEEGTCCGRAGRASHDAAAVRGIRGSGTPEMGASSEGRRRENRLSGSRLCQGSPVLCSSLLDVLPPGVVVGSTCVVQIKPCGSTWRPVSNAECCSFHIAALGRVRCIPGVTDPFPINSRVSSEPAWSPPGGRRIIVCSLSMVTLRTRRVPIRLGSDAMSTVMSRVLPSNVQGPP